MTLKRLHMAHMPYWEDALDPQQGLLFWLFSGGPRRQFRYCWWYVEAIMVLGAQGTGKYL